MKKVLIALLSLVLASATAFAQYQVKGVVEDALGPVIGATVMEVGTTNGVSTGLDGDFVLTVSGADAKVEVSCIGYASQVFPASAVPAKILLGEDTTFLDEVVVVGYGTQKAKDLTAPITNVKGEELAKQVAANPMSALQGMVSGVQITQSGAPGAGPSVKIRGVGSIGDYANPLYIVDGAFMDNIDFLSASDIAAYAPQTASSLSPPRRVQRVRSVWPTTATAASRYPPTFCPWLLPSSTLRCTTWQILMTRLIRFTPLPQIPA